jgi:hypothetical protein
MLYDFYKRHCGHIINTAQEQYTRHYLGAEIRCVTGGHTGLETTTNQVSQKNMHRELLTQHESSHLMDWKHGATVSP